MVMTLAALGGRRNREDVNVLGFAVRYDWH